MLQLSVPKIKAELYRKTIHLSSLWIPYTILTLPLNISSAIFLLLTVLDFLLEYGSYKDYFNLRHIKYKLLFKTLRHKEKYYNTLTLSGAFYILLSAFCCTVLFTKELAATAMLILIISDTSSALIGSYYGKTQILPQKTLEGTFAFIISALLTIKLLTPYSPYAPNIFLAVIIASISELYASKLKLDDNFMIPLAFGISTMVL